VAGKQRQMPRHLGTNNVLYFDGHVKTTKPLDNHDDSQAQRIAVMEAALPYKIAINPNSTGCCGMPTSWN
jgi:prepilin-type processing-associated H-X9-DG protein